jgi:hypothetical protein
MGVNVNRQKMSRHLFFVGFRHAKDMHTQGLAERRSVLCKASSEDLVYLVRAECDGRLYRLCDGEQKVGGKVKVVLFNFL